MGDVKGRYPEKATPKRNNKNNSKTDRHANEYKCFSKKNFFALYTTVNSPPGDVLEPQLWYRNLIYKNKFSDEDMRDSDSENNNNLQEGNFEDREMSSHHAKLKNAN